MLSVIIPVMISILYPSYASASTLPFTIPKNDHSEIQPVSSDSLFGGLIGNFAGIVAPAYKWGIIVITIIFVIGTLAMILSALFKNGQWQKYGQMAMLLSFITLLFLRGMPIIVLSIRNTNDIDILLQEALSILGFAAIFLGLISFAVSFIFSFGYRLIEHPEFHRWSKTLRSVAALMVLFAIITPWLFPLL